MIKTLIVDDEMPARNELKRFLQAESDFEAIGEAADGEEALKLIRGLKPNVVFLDIHIPKLNGLEVTGHLADLKQPPLIVFVTAYDQYAIEAFELHAADYILKPFDQARFAKTCARLRNALLDSSSIKQKIVSLNKYFRQTKPLKIIGHRRGSRERVFIHEQDVIYFHVKLTEVTACLTNGEDLIVNTTLKLLLQMLDANRFQQTHRAFIVNLDKVKKMSPLFSGNFNLVLKDSNQTTIPLSRRYAQQLKRLLNW